MDCPSLAGRSLFFPNTTTPGAVAGGNATKVSQPRGRGTLFFPLMQDEYDDDSDDDSFRVVLVVAFLLLDMVLLLRPPDIGS